MLLKSQIDFVILWHTNVYDCFLFYFFPRFIGIFFCFYILNFKQTFLGTLRKFSFCWILLHTSEKLPPIPMWTNQGRQQNTQFQLAGTKEKHPIIFWLYYILFFWEKKYFCLHLLLLKEQTFFPPSQHFLFFLQWMVSIATYLFSVYLEIHSVCCHF